MLLIQQSSSFRLWTSRALMVYIRRALLFLVISPRQNVKNESCLLQSPTVDFSDAEDDEEETEINDEKTSNQIERNQSNHHLLGEYVFENLSQGFNNSMIEATRELTLSKESFVDRSSRQFNSLEPTITEQFELDTENSLTTINNIENKVSDVSVDQHQLTPIEYHNQIQTYVLDNRRFPSTNSTVSSLINKKTTFLTCPPCLPSFTRCQSSDDETSSSESNKSLLISSNDDEDDIYEKYQNSFSHILHQTKSLDTIRREDQLESMLVLEPNTSIVTVHQLTYHSVSSSDINHLLITSQICVRLIANQMDLSIPSDAKPVGCTKPVINNLIKSISIHDTQQKKSNLQHSTVISNKKRQETSIM